MYSLKSSSLPVSTSLPFRERYFSFFHLLPHSHIPCTLLVFLSISFHSLLPSAIYPFFLSPLQCRLLLTSLYNDLPFLYLPLFSSSLLVLFYFFLTFSCSSSPSLPCLTFINHFFLPRNLSIPFLAIYPFVCSLGILFLPPCSLYISLLYPPALFPLPASNLIFPLFFHTLYNPFYMFINSSLSCLQSLPHSLFSNKFFYSLSPPYNTSFFFSSSSSSSPPPTSSLS